MKKIYRKIQIFLLIAFLLCLAACGKEETGTVSAEETISAGNETASSAVAEGRSVLEQMAQQDPAEVQEHIDALQSQREEEAQTADEEEAEASEEEESSETDTGKEQEEDLYNLSEDEIRELNFTEIFSGCVVMGDSITEGLVTYNYLNSSEVIYKSGISIPSTDDHLAQAQALNPRVVFLSYGSNDISHKHYDYDAFREEFDEFLDRAQTALPDAEIYVNLIFPAKEPLTTRQPWYTETDQYNAVMIEVCEEHGIPYIDSTDLVSDEYYAEDGYHFYGSFYPLWLYDMAKEANLL